MKQVIGSVAALLVSTLAAEDFPISVNQAGYLPHAAKICTTMNPASPKFFVQKGDTDICWHTVYEGTWIDAPSGGGLKLGDFSCVTEPGDYRVLLNTNGIARFRMPDWRPTLQSFHFQIRDGAYDTLKRSLFTYVTWQRCGSPKGWAGVCHQAPVPLKDAKGNTVRMLDARGGYHQSCDLRNWHDGISMSMYALLRWAEIEKPLWDDGDIAEELRWGCDYFLKNVSPEGYIYDAQFSPIGWGPRNYYLAPATLGAECNIVMLFARVSRFFRTVDAVYADRLLASARKVWSQVEENPFFEKPQPAPESNLPAGAQPADRCYTQQYRTSANGYSERAMAALELFRATGERMFADDARRLGGELVKLFVKEGPDAGFFREKDGSEVRGMKDWSYCWRVSGYRTTLELWREFKEDTWKEVSLAIADRIVRTFREKGLRPGSQASSSTAAAHALYLAECATLFDRPDFRPWAQRSFDWVLGVNPWNESYVEGIGQNQRQRPVFGQFYPSTPQIPGAVLHVCHGEYDMPPGMLLLWASALVGK